MTPATNSIVPAVIIGAGPYGLSLAAHLREAGIPFRIFGRPMQTWATQMPTGMKLKSDGFASNLSAGSKSFTLEDFCRLTGRPYHPTLIPVAVEDFIAYGQEFARRFVPHLEQYDVASVEQERILGTPGLRSTGFLLTLATGERLRAQHVIVATGLSLFQHIPQRLAALSRELVTHTSDHTTFNEFANRDVVVLGRGASSLNAAVLLHEAGSRVTLVSRSPRIHLHHTPADQPRNLLARLRRPETPLGLSLRSWLCCAAPALLHALPERLRSSLMYKHLGPAGGHALQGRVDGKFPIHLGWSIESSELLYKLGKGGTGESLIKLTLVNALDWSGIGTSVTTCFFVALGSLGESVHKMSLRIVGALLGAAMGIGAIILLMPWMTDLLDLLPLLAAASFVGAWVGSGSPRIAYAGLQISFAFFIVTLQGYGPTTDMESAKNRVVGILVGNVVSYVVMAYIWPVRVDRLVTSSLADAAAALGRLLRRPAVPHEARETFAAPSAKARAQLADGLFEGAPPGRIHVDERLADQVEALVIPVSMLAATDERAYPETLAAWFEQTADRLRGGASKPGAFLPPPRIPDAAAGHPVTYSLLRRELDALPFHAPIAAATGAA